MAIDMKASQHIDFVRINIRKLSEEKDLSTVRDCICMVKITAKHRCINILLALQGQGFMVWRII
ncbi:hypothetical protein AWH67_03365 [Bartonella bacilliformis]|nr:hypothetical protein AWH67_03365 [Bartonella bacilliformis]